MDHRTMSRKGGLVTQAKYGDQFLRTIGKRGGKAMKAKYGPDYFEKLSRMGVEARLKKTKKTVLE